MPELFSIGYATKPLDTFLAQLRQHRIDAIADVRSVPYSKAFHDYPREPLAASLRAAGIHYVYLGDELGPRSKDPAHYDDRGQVQFDRLQTAELFLNGIERVFAGMKKSLRIALMCAEKDPATCHRSLLIGHYLLHQRQQPVLHIEHDGVLEDEAALERRLMQIQNIQPDMLTPECACLPLAWQAQCRQHAYRKPD
ncbi:DUF488 family protein [Spongiibacter tropicus]|uniref:DUF488 domain-containing protein n=1 Tax=Spongiibacter tropicus TaxID=454602 RepID=UPI002353E873|nr:DUF488 domain-containing protein [Spongiibacter tropicus]